MKRLEIYTGEKTYMYPNGELGVPERIKTDFPAIDYFTHVIETDESGEVCYAVVNLNAMKSLYEIPLKTDEATAIEMLEEIINKPPEESIEPGKFEQLSADVDYLFMMTGVEL